MLYLFWYVWKDKTHSCTICYQLDLSGGSVFKFTVANPLDKLCYRKRFGKTRVKHVIGLNEGGQDHRLIAKQKQNNTNKQTKQKTKQNRTEQNRTEQNRTEQSRREQNRTEQNNRTERNRTEQIKTKAKNTNKNTETTTKKAQHD